MRTTEPKQLGDVIIEHIRDDLAMCDEALARGWARRGTLREAEKLRSQLALFELWKGQLAARPAHYH